MRMTLKQFSGAAVAASLLASGSIVSAETPPKPVGTGSIDETQFGLIIGDSTGGGVLTFNGKQYPFTLGGFSLGANIGVSKFTATGEVYDMTDISQFAGTYTQLSGSYALGGGKGSTNLKNQNGVIMSLEGTTQGLQLNVGSSGVTVTLKPQ